MKYQLSKMVTSLSLAVVFVVGVVQPACLGIWFEPAIPEDILK